MRRKTILFVVNRAEFFISHRLPLALAAKREGFEVAIACAKSENFATFNAEGFTCHALPMTRSGLNVIRELWALIQLLHQLKPDIVHLITIKPVLLGGIAARLSKAPAVVYAISGLGYVFIAQGALAKLRLFLVKLGYRLALKHQNSRVIFQNKDDKNLFIRHNLVHLRQCKLIKGSGVDLQEFKPTAHIVKDAVCVVLPARMLRDKGIYEFVYAAQTILERNVKAQFLLVGGLDEKGNPASLSQAEINSFSGVDWLGHVEDIKSVYARCDIVCLPSYREGLPKTLIEACACGKPIVTTDAPGCRDAVEDGKNGYLVPVKSIHSLVDALLTLIEDANLRQSFGDYSRQKALREFSIDDVVARTLAIYRTLSVD